MSIVSYICDPLPTKIKLNQLSAVGSPLPISACFLEFLQVQACQNRAIGKTQVTQGGCFHSFADVVGLLMNYESILVGEKVKNHHDSLKKRTACLQPSCQHLAQSVEHQQSCRSGSPNQKKHHEMYVLCGVSLWFLQECRVGTQRQQHGKKET